MYFNYLNKRISACLFLTIFICLIVSLFGCKKFVENNSPKDRISSEIQFSDSINATAAVTGIYIDLINSVSILEFLNGGNTFYTGLYSDELYSTNTTDASFYLNGLNSISDQTVSTFWRNAYLFIYRANACIEGVASNPVLSQRLQNQLIGESKLVRAWVYYNLIRLFGDVPLILTTNYKVNAIMPRTSISNIEDKIIEDLKEAKDKLSENYGISGRIRPNKYAPVALLARLYIEKKDWILAESEASLIIANSNLYSLESDLNRVFLSASKEGIWQLIANIGNETAEGYVLPANATTIPRFNLSNSLLSAFEVNDQRKVKWVAKNTVSGTDYYYPFKYKVRRGNAGQEATERYTIFRLAEIYLIRAEARAYLNDIPGSASDLNIIRNRAGLGTTTANDQTSLLNAILKERRIELFCEQGHRWYDLKRTNTANAVMSIITPLKGGTWNSDKLLFPIPFDETQINPFLTQNPGYQ